PQFAHCLHGIGTGRLPFHRAQTRRHDTVITAALKRMPENSLGHGAAANVARANEKDRLHLCVNLMNLSRGSGIVNGEIIFRYGVPALAGWTTQNCNDSVRKYL